VAGTNEGPPPVTIAPSIAGPVRPSPSAAVAHRPLAGTGTRLEGGLLADWQHRNATASLPLALRQLDTAGNLDNLRLAIAGGGWQYRGPLFMDSDIYKTLEAISWELQRGRDAGLSNFAATTTALLAKAQQADGYLNSYVQATGAQRYVRLQSSHELYCAGHLIQAAVAASRGFGDDQLLRVARYFANHLVDSFLGGQQGLDGHPIVETALTELYRETGEKAYLTLAKQFVDQRGHGLIGDSGFGIRYLQDHMPVRESPTIVGHAVRALYLEAGIADVAAETGDSELLDTSIARWEDMVATKTALTGSIGSRHSGEAFGDAYELPPDRAYNETCASIASFQWSWRLLLATGDGRYADLMERVLYNGFGAALSTNGQRFFYVNPLQRRVDHFEDDDPGRRREWFSCACCPPNIMRLIASLQHYLATVAGDVLHVHLLTGARIAAPLPSGLLDVQVITGYPWAGRAELRVLAAPGGDCGLAVRIPAWSREHSVTVNGLPVAAGPDANGYVVVRRPWAPGDVLAVMVDARPRLTYPARRIDALRGSAAVERGPLVYCFEQADQARGNVEDLALAPGGTGLRPGDPAAGALTERAVNLPEIGPTVVIEAAAAAFPPAEPGGLPYTPTPAGAGASAQAVPATAAAIPYFQWDNRDGQAMRVWMPTAPPITPAASPPSGNE
jgi:uncharacterized protein